GAFASPLVQHPPECSFWLHVIGLDVSFLAQQAHASPPAFGGGAAQPAAPSTRRTPRIARRVRIASLLNRPVPSASSAAPRGSSAPSSGPPRTCPQSAGSAVESRTCGAPIR